MKKNNLLQGAIVALLVASPFAAYADSQYPATDFEPKVLYQDESIKSSAPAVKAAPAAAAPVAAASADDSQYPATNFQPKVLFSDANYKHDKSAPSIAPTSAPEFTTSAGAVIMEQAAEKKAAKEDDNSLFLILGALAVAGFAASRCPKFAGIFGGNSMAETEVNANRETGVARYLNARVPKVSGVTKYLERNVRPTNVARYIAKQNIAQKAAQNDTDRG
ncbi:MAG: hypothetical protein PHQ03_00170 [Methylococcales bacterium]|nr:hypothetical protein [Methylococcales bacterium]